MLSNDSNYFVLSSYRLPRQERAKRLQYLEDSIIQLKAYHAKARRSKKPYVMLLIGQYELLADKLNRRLSK